ncbi:unnamed protein product [Penicillium roqueforti FM164]|uniref:Genomic scaffold, ProqFM164S02 n=1 Tax=Penicillium roqueforti (strain FM164) TaxID=1365484 RepID=W6Q3K0_PENRF|nr:unnamed protein product [Penicillium roqueforti FM164]
MDDIERSRECDESVLAYVVYPLHRRNRPINTANLPTRQGVEEGTCVSMHGTLYVCADTEIGRASVCLAGCAEMEL